MNHSVFLLVLLSLTLIISCDEVIELKQGEFYHGTNANSFHLSIVDITSIKSVSIELTCYKGNCDIPSLYTDAAMTNKVDITLSSASRKIILKTESLSNNYYFSNTCENNCYFKLQSVNNNPTNYILEKEYANIILLSQGEKENTYTVSKKEPTNSTPVLLFINAINCIPSVTLGEATYDTSKYIQYTIEDSTVDFTFSMQVKAMDSDSTSLTEKCSINVDVIDDDFETSAMSVNEGFTNQYKLTNNLSRLNFRYHLHSGGLMITLNDISNGGLNVEVYQSTMTPPALLTRKIHGRKTILLETPTSDLIFVVVKSSTKNYDDIPFSIMINSKAGYPVYFNKNVANYQYMYPKSTMNYYTDIKEGDEGLININLKQGGGKICARVVDKDVIESNHNWLHRVNLDMCTNGTLNNYIPLVPLIKKYSQDKCKNGCELYISINNQEEALKDNNYVNEITITYHKTEEPITFPLNEDIHGDSTSDFFEDIYYTTTVDVDTESLLISFSSNFYRMFINFDKEEMPSPFEYTIRYSKNGVYLLKADTIGKTTFKGVKINIAFQTSYLYEGENQYYFKIVPQYKNSPIIYRASNAKSEVCTITSEGVCYFLVNIHEYENIDSFTVTGVKDLDDNKASIDSDIYINIEDADTIDTILYNSETISTYLPAEGKCIISGQTIVTIPKDKFKTNTDFYAIIAYKPQNEGTYEFLVSTNINANNAFIPYLTNPKFIYVPANEERKLGLYQIKFDDFQGYNVLGSGAYTSQGNTYVSIEMKGETNGNGVFFTKKVLKPITYYELELNKMTTNKITDFTAPIYYLLNITDENILSLSKEITIQIKNYMFEYSEHKDTKDTFNITGTTVDEIFFKSFINHLSIEPIKPFREGIYNAKENMGIIKLEPNTYYPYLLIKVEKNNNNSYKSISSDLIAYIKNNKVPSFSVPQNKFFTSIIRNTDREKYIIFKLAKKTSTDTLFSVELASSDETGEYGFSIEKMKEVPAFKNDTELVKSSIMENSYSRFILSVPSTQDENILVTFFKKNEDEVSNDEALNVLVKYETANDEASFPKFEYDQEIKVKQDNKTLGVTIEAQNIIKGKDNVNTINYCLRIYNKTKDFNVNLVNHLFESSEVPAYKPLFEDTASLSAETESYIFTKNGTELANETYILIFTSFSTNDGSEFKFGYTPKEANITTVFPSDPVEPVKPTEPSEFNWWILLIIVVAIVLLCLIGGGILFFIKRDKLRKKGNDINFSTQSDNLLL